MSRAVKGDPRIDERFEDLVHQLAGFDTDRFERNINKQSAMYGQQVLARVMVRLANAVKKCDDQGHGKSLPNKRASAQANQYALAFTARRS